MARQGSTDFFSRVRRTGLGNVIEELTSGERLRERLERVGERLAGNKQMFDRNVESMLKFVNVPSRRDLREIKERIDHLSHLVANLGLKVDRLQAARRRPAGRKSAG